MTKILWFYAVVLVLAPLLGWAGRRLFQAPNVALAADPGPLIDSAPTTTGTAVAVARMHTLTVLAAGLILLPSLGFVATVVPIVLLAERAGHGPPLSPWLFVVLYLALAAIGVPLCWRVRSSARRGEPLRFEVYRDRLRLPVESLIARHVTLPLASLRSVDAPADGCLVIDTTSDTFVLPGKTFVDPASIPRLRDAIVTQVGLLPDGAEILARSKQDAEALREYAQRPAPATAAAVALCVAAFVLELVVGMGDHALFRMGANVRPLTWQGDWYRLFTANFLHVGFWHLLFNVSFISTVGGVVERAVGPGRFLVIYLSSGVAGAAVSSRIDFMSAGASTAAFGLIGALAVLQYRYGHILPAGFRLHAGRWVVLFGVNAALPFLFPNISWAGHVGGLIGGVATCGVLARSPEALAGGAAPRGVRIFGGLLVVVHLYSFLLAAGYARSSADFETEFTDAVAADPGGSPAEWNNLAWSIATSPTAPAARLKAALRLAERAAKAGGIEATDTLAQVLHRVGNDDEAIRREAQLVLQSGQDAYATQLLRFLAARRRWAKAPLVEPGVEDLPLVVGLPPTGPGGPRLAIVAPVLLPKGLVVYMVGRPGGLLELCIGAGPAGMRPATFVGRNVPQGVDFEAGYLAASECPAGRARFFAAADPAVKRLP